ncbi:MAG: DUF4884 domain-containing protein [Tannerella sp.]|jgi:hypothetical protein|nr:DUF4884 domain-containing protein [Tannerella sp.]
MIMKKMFALIFSCSLISCGGIPILTTVPHNNKTYDVEYLFEHDGCKVYSFYDRGNRVYFTNCNGDVTSFVNDSTSTRTVTISRKQQR